MRAQTLLGAQRRSAEMKKPETEGEDIEVVSAPA